MNKLKVVIYTICKNEQQFVDKFMDCLTEADAVYVTDTGSTDNTVQMLRARGAIVNEIVVNPWRFEDARNISLAFVPEDVDVCFCMDLDEVVTPGWREAIEKNWTKDTARMRYLYAWSHDDKGNPATTFWYDKIHQRKNYRWVKPVHEVLKIYNQAEVQTICEGFTLHHWPDKTKSRGSYLGLLELAVAEAPLDDRSSHYLGREYMFYKQWDKSIAELKRHLSLQSAVWESERSASMRFISRCYAGLGDLKSSETWALKSCAEAPTEREPWVELGKIYYFQANWHGAYYAMKQALSIVERPKSYICEPECWDKNPHDYLSIAAYRLGLLDEAYEQCLIAIQLDGDNDPRLANNLQLISTDLQCRINGDKA